ncbi:MAG: hypothetical protein HFJ12_02400 [Bacilli bacterium]|nr:hypothetical protein [Bacilli bacterium]
MPATAAHAFFADDVYKKLKPKTKRLIQKDRKSLLMFAQSTDSMMFYNLLSIKKGKDLRKLSHIFHTEKTNQYFYNLINDIKKNRYYHDSQTVTLLYGFICHYCLDTIAHPFIFYKTGRYEKNQKETIKYNSLHNYMETFIDNTLIKMRGFQSKQFSFRSLCFDFKKFSKELKNTLDNSFDATYHVKNMGKIYYRSLKQMCFILQVFRIDRYGIKKFFYKLIDHITPKTVMRLESISYYKIPDQYDYLNKRKKKWYYPSNDNISSQKNFFELYEEGVEKAVDIIEQINDYFYNDNSIDINHLFQNKSYLTGLDCDKKLNLRFFEF